MASRINTRLLLILLVVVTFIVVVVGAVAFLKIRGDATRFVRAGDEAVAAEDFRAAKKFYARAVSKDATNLTYVRMWQDVLLKIRPQTADEARELYGEYISLLKHAVDHQPARPEHHLAILEEIYEFARVSDSPTYWGELKKSAETMWNRVPDSKPERAWALFYRGAATLAPTMQDRLLDEELAAGEQDLEEFVRTVPDNDRGWSRLITGRLAATERLQAAGQPLRTQESLDKVRATLASALEHAPDGPEVQLARMRVALFEQITRARDVSFAEMRDGADELVRRMQASGDPWIVSQAAELLLLMRQRLASFYGDDIDELARPVEVVEGYLAAHPDRHDLRLFKARLHYIEGELDEAEAAIAQVMDAELLPVSYLSQLQFELRRRAASLNVDIALQRWDEAPGDQKQSLLADLLERQDELIALSQNAEDDPLVLRARGKVAFARREYALAADLFDRIVREQVRPDVEMLQFAALALEQQGVLGRAADHLATALTVAPGSVSLLEQRARLLARMRKYDDAEEVLAELIAIDPNNRVAMLLQEDLVRFRAGDEGGAVDPEADLLGAAQALVDKGDIEGAVSMLEAAVDADPENLRLLNGLIRLEIVAGRSDDAKRLLDRALALSPNSRTFRNLEYAVEHDDPIDAMWQYARDVYDDESDQVVQVLNDLSRLAARQEAIADQREADGLAEDAAAARADAERFRTEERKVLARAEEIAKDHPRYIEYRFLEAAVAEDWDALDAVVDRARVLDIDQVGGALYEGRALTIRGDLEGAIRALRTATDRKPYAANAWQLLALTYQSLGNFSEALRAFENSYENNPNDLLTIRAYSELLDRTGAKTRGLLVLRSGRMLYPGNRRLQHQWLLLEEEVGSQAVMLRERQKLYETDPDEMANAVALARYLGTTMPIRETLLDDDGAERYSVERWDRMPARDRDRIIEDERELWIADAGEIVENLAGPEDRDLTWYQLKSDLLRAQGDLAAGAQLLESWIARQGDPTAKVDGSLVLGRHLALANQSEDALTIFRRALPLQADDDRRVDRAMAELLFRLNRFDEALASLERVIAVDPAREIRLQATEALVNLERYEEARERLAAIVAESGADYTTTLLEASITDAEADRLRTAGRDADAQRLYDAVPALLDKAAELNPLEPMPYIQRGRLLYKTWQRTRERIALEDALRALARADEIRAGALQTSLVRAAVLQALGNPPAVVNELTEVLERFPESEQARTLLLQVLVSERRFDRATEVAGEAVRLNPASALWRERLADLHVRSTTPDPVAAIEQYRAALLLDPSARILEKMVDAMLALDPPDSAGAIRTVEASADQLEESPGLRGRYAYALALGRRRPEALEQLRLSYAQHTQRIADGEWPPQAIDNWFIDVRRVFPAREWQEADSFMLSVTGDDPAATELRAMAKLWPTSGRDLLDRAMGFTERALAKTSPDDRTMIAGLNFEIGVYRILRGDNEAALAAFETVLEIDPENATALNNVAYLHGEVLDQPERALPYAERAAKASPSDANVLDTLGWIQFKLRNYEDAETNLRLASQISESASIHLHLSQLFLARNDLTRAQRYLERAAEANAAQTTPDPETREEIDRIADDIRTRRENRQ